MPAGVGDLDIQLSPRLITNPPFCLLPYPTPHGLQRFLVRPIPEPLRDSVICFVLMAPREQLGFSFLVSCQSPLTICLPASGIWLILLICYFLPHMFSLSQKIDVHLKNKNKKKKIIPVSFSWNFREPWGEISVFNLLCLNSSLQPQFLTGEILSLQEDCMVPHPPPIPSSSRSRSPWEPSAHRTLFPTL